MDPDAPFDKIRVIIRVGLALLRISGYRAGSKAL